MFKSFYYINNIVCYLYMPNEELISQVLMSHDDVIICIINYPIFSSYPIIKSYMSSYQCIYLLMN